MSVKEPCTTEIIDSSSRNCEEDTFTYDTEYKKDIKKENIFSHATNSNTIRNSETLTNVSVKKPCTREIIDSSSRNYQEDTLKSCTNDVKGTNIVLHAINSNTIRADSVVKIYPENLELQVSCHVKPLKNNWQNSLLLKSRKSVQCKTQTDVHVNVNSDLNLDNQFKKVIQNKLTVYNGAIYNTLEQSRTLNDVTCTENSSKTTALSKKIYQGYVKILPKDSTKSVVSLVWVHNGQSLQQNVQSKQCTQGPSTHRDISSSDPNISQKEILQNGIRGQEFCKINELTHTGSIFCKCQECRKKVKASRSTIDTRSRKFGCEKCGKGFLQKAYLMRHLKKIHEGKKHVCTQCSKAYADSHYFKLHMLTAHMKEKIKCQECDKVFTHEFSFKDHYNKFHKNKIATNSEKSTIMCNICCKYFQSLEHMIDHKRKQHDTFICNECSSVFSSKPKLKDHIFTAHMPPTIKCPECGDLLHTRDKLKHHLRSQHLIDKRELFICETCGHSSRGLRYFQSHLLTHSNEMPFVCEECGNRFRTSSNLIQHSMTHSDVRKFSCELCGKSFKIRHHLKQHMAVHGMVSTASYRRKRRRNNKSSSDSSSSCDSAEDDSN